MSVEPFQDEQEPASRPELRRKYAQDSSSIRTNDELA
jgi:hypothetical protein